MPLDIIYNKYKKSVNMTYQELLKWSKTECSKKASLNRAPITRNLLLLKTPKSKWTWYHERQANKVISYLARAKKIKGKNYIKECKYTKNQLAMKNWAYDIKKKQ